MAFESYALYPQKTVYENLASPLRSGRTGTYSGAGPEQRIDLVTTTLGINPLLKRFPRELSNGQRQRVALGRVLVREADVYLLDEPLSHLDAKLRAAMRAELKQLGRDVEHHHAVRDARLPGGALARRPDRGAAPRQARAGRHARADLARARERVRGQGAGAARDQPDRRRAGRGRVRQVGGGIEFAVPGDVGRRARAAGAAGHPAQRPGAGHGGQPQRRRVAARGAAPSPSPSGWAATSSSPCTWAAPR